MVTNKSTPHLQIRHNLSGLLLPNWKWLHPLLITFNKLCLVEFYIQCCEHFNELVGAFKTINVICFCLASWFYGKANTVGSHPNFSKGHIPVVGNPSTTILYHVVITPTLNIFLKITYVTKKDTKVGSQSFGHQVWFCTRLLKDIIFIEI